MPVKLPDAVRDLAIEAVQMFFQSERDESVGALQAGFLVDAVLAAAGPAVYNRGVRDAQTHLLSVVNDLDTVVFKTEPASRR